jgi:2,4-diaminopentanoate dehydrogenase
VINQMSASAVPQSAPISSVRAAVVGLGQAAASVVEGCRGRRDVAIVAAVSGSPAKIGEDVGTVLGGEAIGAKVAAEVDAVLGDVDVVLLTAHMPHAEAAEQIGRCLDAGVDVITVNGFTHAGATVGEEWTEELRSRAVAGGARLLGTGVNPGFLLDALPVLLATNLPRVDRLKVRRVSDAASWSPTLLQAMGIGEPFGSEVDFEVSLQEQLRALIDGLSLGVEETDEVSEPLAAASDREAAGIAIPKGSNVGVRRVARGLVGGVPILEVEWLVLVAIDREADGVEASAEATIEGGGETVANSISGTLLVEPYMATAMRMVNSVRPLRSLPPGIYRPDQIPSSPISRPA